MFEHTTTVLDRDINARLGNDMCDFKRRCYRLVLTINAQFVFKRQWNNEAITHQIAIIEQSNFLEPRFKMQEYLGVL